jgi:hypothetical protein
MVAVFLITETGNVLSPAWYLVGVSVIAAWMTLIMHGHQEEEAR